MTDWITHEGTKPPLLAPASLVEHEVWYDEDRPWFGGITVSRVDAFDGNLWHSGLVYRPLTDEHGRKYVSAEGLEPWTEWVATDEDGTPWQFQSYPVLDKDACDGSNIWASVNEEIAERAPATHRHPGDYRDSLCRAWREDHD